MPKPTKRSAAQLLSTLPVVCLGAMPFTSVDGEPLPTRIKIANWGRNYLVGSKKEFFVNEQTVRELPTAQASFGYDAVAGDYEHQSVKGSPTYKPDPREYWARAGQVEVVPGEGIYYSPGEYTPSGRKHAAGYQDVSGFFRLDPKTRAVRAVASVALCEHGQVEGIEFVQASIAIAAAMSPGYGGAADPEALEQLLTYTRDLLEVNEDATIDDLTTGMEALVRAKNTPDPTKPSTTKPNKPMTPEQEAALAATNKQITDLTASVNSLAGSVTTIAASMQTSQHNTLVEAEFTAASLAGKVIPDTLKKKDDKGKYVVTPELVKDVVAAIPQTVETQFSTPAHVATASHATAAAGTTEQICASLGITKEAYEKDIPMKKGNEPHGEAKKKLAAAA